MNKTILKKQVRKLINSGAEKHFINFFVKDEFYKKIPSDNLKPGMFINHCEKENGETPILIFFDMDQEDNFCVQDTKKRCDEVIAFLYDPDR
ncbi:MAG TPA: hypothetical protein VMV77_03485 [Bacteroidales bacterium]|nr:hypothetical protein [Bacteroidales bacterium]